jgi:hypothetical protein
MTGLRIELRNLALSPKRTFTQILVIKRKPGRGGDRRSVDVHLTLDMAKELAMVERNEVGRNIRRYFIQKEKEARGISHLPVESKLFSGLKPKQVNDRRLFPYKEVLERCGYSTKASTAQRRARYWMHFVKDGHTLYVTAEFASHLFRQRQVMNNRAVMLACQPVLPLNFGEKIVGKNASVQ